MRPYFLGMALAAASVIGVARAGEASERYVLKPVAGGGFAIERASPEAKKFAHGLASMAELVSLLRYEAKAPEKIDFTAGKKLDGVFTVLVGRDDGTLGKFDRASDVVIFAAPESISTTGDVTTLWGAVVFALKIDNAGVAPVQRFETGAITLTQARKSL
jgi:hypothetical protein